MCNFSTNYRPFLFYMASYIDLIGQKFGNLTVIGYREGSKGIRCMRVCKCDCGNIVLKTDKYLKNRKTRTCGCHLIKETKVCSVCKKAKAKSNFHKRKDRTTGVSSKCKKCMSEYKKKRYWSDHEVELEKLTKSRTKPENILQRKRYYEMNKKEYHDRYKKYITDPIKKETFLENRRKSRIKIKNKERESIQKREYNKRPEVRERLKKTHHKKKVTDINYVIKRRLRSRLRQVTKRLGSLKYKYRSSLLLLGCDMDFFKIYLESTFKDGISWDNISLWHIDHIKPCAKFNLTDFNEQKKCFHYSNLQALWGIDNLKKNDKYEESALI